MTLQLDVPPDLLDALQSRAAQVYRSVQDVAIQAIRNDLGSGFHTRSENRGPARHSIQLPLVPSGEPGALRSLTNAEIDELDDR